MDRFDERRGVFPFSFWFMWCSFFTHFLAYSIFLSWYCCYNYPIYLIYSMVPKVVEEFSFFRFVKGNYLLMVVLGFQWLFISQNLVHSTSQYKSVQSGSFFKLIHFFRIKINFGLKQSSFLLISPGESKFILLLYAKRKFMKLKTQSLLKENLKKNMKFFAMKSFFAIHFQVDHGMWRCRSENAFLLLTRKRAPKIIYSLAYIIISNTVAEFWQSYHLFYVESHRKICGITR